MTFGNGDIDQRPPATPAFDFQVRSSAPSSGPTGPTGTPGGTHDFGLTSSRTSQRRRRGVDTRAVGVTVGIVVGAVVVLAAAGLTGWTLVQNAEAEVKADSAAMCADLATTPGVLAQPGFGWPTEVADLPATLEAMKAYEERWKTLAAIAPPTIQPSVESVATAATTLVDGVEATRSIDRPGNLAKIQLVTSQSVLPAWVEKYCD